MAAQPALGVGRSLLFVAIMACVHAVGYRLYEQKRASYKVDDVKTVKTAKTSVIASYGAAIKVMAIQHLCFLVLTMLMLDGEKAFRICCIAVLVHWGCTTMFIVRRPTRPTGIDLLIIKFGFLPLTYLIGCAAVVIYHWRGM